MSLDDEAQLLAYHGAHVIDLADTEVTDLSDALMARESVQLVATVGGSPEN